MALAAVQRVYIIAHEATKDTLLEALQTEGILHIETLSNAERGDLVEPFTAETREIDRKLADVQSAVDFLGRFTPPQGFMASLAGGKIELSAVRFNEYAADKIIEETLEGIRSIQQERADLEVRSARLASTLQHLEPWRGLEVPLEKLESSATVEVFSGSVPTRSVEPMRDALGDTGETWMLHEVSIVRGRAYVVLISLKDDGRDAERILREFGFQPALFPQSDGTAAHLQDSLIGELTRLKEQQQRLETEAAKLSGERVKLMAAFDRLTQTKQRIEAIMTAHATGESIVLSGWIETDDRNRLMRVVESVSPETVVLDREPLPEDEPPVAMVNKPLVEPFRVVTNLYGLPKSREIDPTPFLAPFFAISFGIAIGEGGYGVLLALLSRLGLKFLKLGEGGKRLLRLLFYCGIVTFVAGVLMGSFFAIAFDTLPDTHWLRTAHDHLQLLNPLEDSLLFLGIVLGIGFLQVWFGVLIGGIIKWQSGDKKSAIFHDGAWLVLLPLTLLLGRSVAGIPALYLWLIAALSIFVSAGFNARGIGAKVGTGVYALYGLTGFFGDILSYSRLFALGLATGVIAQVVNILAGMVGGIPVIGWLAMLVLLVFGHLFNLAINALGAFIHTARLQFVEFFTKFFEGGGRRFVPFCRQFKFTTLIDKPPQGETE